MLAKILNCDRLTTIVDVGASPVDGEPPYKAMLDKCLCQVTGFEPNPDALAELVANKSPREKYLPDAVGPSGTSKLHKFPFAGMNSLLAPDVEALSAFSSLKQLIDGPIEMEDISTTPLDGLVGQMDMLKIDVQGSELSVFDSSPRLMSQVVAVHTEVALIPIYKGQPVFGEVDLALRKFGLVPHSFAEIKQAMIGPVYMKAKKSASFRQIFEADIVYVRDFTKMDAMSDEQLTHLAMIAHYVYGSADLVVRCLTWLVKRGALNADGPSEYLRWAMLSNV